MAKPIPAAVVEVVEEAPVSPLTIAQNDETREMFADCKPGDQKWVLLQIDTHDDASITATPMEVEYSDDEEDVQEDVEDDAGQTMPKAIRKISKAGY